MKHILLPILLFFVAGISAQMRSSSVLPIEIEQPEQIVYHAYENGDRMVDFSFCGYMASEQEIDEVAVKVFVPWQKEDATLIIQRAIDHVGSLPLDENGFRGAVWLDKGIFTINGSLLINNSGVVLRGSGCYKDGTVLFAAGAGRETLVKVAGKNDKTVYPSVEIANQYVPVGTNVLPVNQNHGLNVGDNILVMRPSTKEWIEALGADKIGNYVDYSLTAWSEGDFDILWERTVTAVTPTSVMLDIPITTSLDPQFGGGYVSRYQWPGRIRRVGIENLRFISEYDMSNEKDENHRWMAITVENAEDGWIRRVIAEHFVSSAVALWETTRRFTVEDCKNLSPVGEIGAYRRYAFQTLGQQNLFQRCYSEYGYHDFSVGFTTAGPNAFLQCYAYHPHHFSGATGGWSNGTLFEKVTVDGGILSVGDRDVNGQGGGWSGANTLFWQCRAAQLHVPNPPHAYNWAYGSAGQGYGDGLHAMHRGRFKPESIFYAQLESRTGKKSPNTEKYLIYEPNNYGLTIPAYTHEMSVRSKEPETTMNEWIDKMIAQSPLPVSAENVKSIHDIKFKTHESPRNNLAPPLTLTNGTLMFADKIAHGKTIRTTLWRGDTRPAGIKKASPNLVRFVPGRTGRGLTDDLDTLVSDMLENKQVALNFYPSLWYERRRDDHTRVRRADADVWAPFYEQPFARSGQGEAMDRLSKYDLNKYNTWYWLRLNKFAEMADYNGLIFIQDHYLQHNIIEEGGHWMDYPWRSANNINHLGFSENVYFADDKRVFMADEFYDTTHVVRREYHRNYIRKCLSEFARNTNTIHHLGAEYTGPVHFVRFWLNIIREWEQETGHDAKIMLPGTKDVQDSILSDPEYGQMIDIIDIRQWQYRPNGSLYAPEGGVSLTARQYIRYLSPGEGSFDGVYRAVSEYRNAYPDKAVSYAYGHGQFPMINWAIFVAGGCLADIPPISTPGFYKDATKLSPMEQITIKGSQWGMGKATVGYIVFSSVKEVVLDLKNDNTLYTLRWINPKNGEITGKPQHVKGGRKLRLTSPSAQEQNIVAWLSRK